MRPIFWQVTWFFVISSRRVTVQPGQNNVNNHLYETQSANFCELILFDCWLLILFFHFSGFSNQTSLFVKTNINQLILLG